MEECAWKNYKYMGVYCLMVYLGCGWRCILDSYGSLRSTERPVGVVCVLLIRTR